MISQTTWLLVSATINSSKLTSVRKPKVTSRSSGLTPSINRTFTVYGHATLSNPLSNVLKSQLNNTIIVSVFGSNKA